MLVRCIACKLSEDQWRRLKITGLNPDHQIRVGEIYLILGVAFVLPKEPHGGGVRCTEEQSSASGLADDLAQHKGTAEERSARSGDGSGSALAVSGATARTWGSYLPGTEAGERAAQHWADLHVKTGNPLYAVPGILASLWTPDTAVATATTLLGGGAGNIGVRLGREVSFGKNFRIAPFGNRTGHPLGELPHYHRRGVDPRQGIGRHRPWETKSPDKSFWDRF
jgi:hypothetical protein